MRVALFGANGNLGLILQDRLLHENYEINAMLHGEISTKKSGITYIQGDALKYDDVRKTIEGCEAVIDVLGGDEKSTIRSQATSQIVKAMQNMQIKHVIAMGGSGILSVGPWRFEQMPVFPKDKRFVTKDHERVHQILLGSGLDWTQVCPSVMTNGQTTGKYKVRVKHPFLMWRQSIRLADVADFIVKELSANNYLHMQVTLIN